MKYWKLSLKIMQEEATKHGGKCLSKRYRSVRHKMKFQCKHGHIWKTFPFIIRANSWCPTCSNANKGQSQKHTLPYLQRFAKKSGGKLLSRKYHNVMGQLKWRCKDGHVFYDSAHLVLRRKGFCQKCAVPKKTSKSRT